MSVLELIAQARHDGMCEGQINASGTLMLRLADALEEAQGRVAELEGRPVDWLPTSSGGETTTAPGGEGSNG